MIQQESKILFCFSPLLHVYSETYHAAGLRRGICDTAGARRSKTPLQRQELAKKPESGFIYSDSMLEVDF